MAANGVCPSFDEIMVSQGLRSKSGVHRLISALEERGLIRRLSGKARAIELIDYGAQKAVLLDPATFGLVAAYADARQIGIDDAADAIIRERLGVAA